MRAVILAGGKGTRLAPYTTVFPKPMLPIGGKPIIEIIVHQLAYYGFNDIIISVGYLSELIELYFHNKKILPKKVKISFVKEKKPLGTAGSISLIPPCKDPFLVINGDILTSLDFSKFMDFHKKEEADLSIATRKVDYKLNMGIVKFDSNKRVYDYLEKPTEIYYDSMGVYIYSPSAVEEIEKNKYLDLPSLVHKLIKKNKKVSSFLVERPEHYYWIDMGMPLQYEQANLDFIKFKKKFWK